MDFLALNGLLHLLKSVIFRGQSLLLHFQAATSSTLMMLIRQWKYHKTNAFLVQLELECSTMMSTRRALEKEVV